MEKTNKIEQIIDLEKLLNSNTDLLEIAKVYCESNCNKSPEVSSLISILEIVLKNQKNVIRKLDTFIA